MVPGTMVVPRHAGNTAALLLAAWVLVGCAASSPEPAAAPSPAEAAQPVAAANANDAGQAAPPAAENARGTTGNGEGVGNKGAAANVAETPAPSDDGAFMGKRKPLPPLPAIFDVSLDASPNQLERRLTELGYKRQEWTLEAPYSRLTFTLADTAATFHRVDMLVCNHPLKIANLHIRGSDRKGFYEAVKQRFNLGIADWQKDDEGSARYGKYVREFAGHVRAVLHSGSYGAELCLEARGVKEECQSALARDVDALRAAEQADIDAARQRQRDAF